MQTRISNTGTVIYTLSVQCIFGPDYDDECVRVIEIPDGATLETLHLAIQEAASFENDHLYDFYAGRHHRNRKRRYTFAEEWDEREGDFAQICLRDVYPLGSLKLYYVFDLGDAWTFEIRKLRKVQPPQLDMVYPRTVERRGADPQQYPPLE